MLAIARNVLEIERRY